MHKFYNIIDRLCFKGKALYWAVSIPLSMILFSSCSIYDDEMECSVIYKVKFSYYMNMSGGDGFAAQVSSVNIWLFDHDSGMFVKEYSDEGNALSEKEYTLELVDLKPGNYDLIVWGGLGSESSFKVSSDIRKKSDLDCRLMAKTVDGQKVSDQLLTPLFYGNLDNQIMPDTPGEYLYKVDLMKDTNNINISLQHMSDDPLSADDFTVFMVDDNTELAFNNSVIPSSSVTYFPWSMKSGEIDMPGEDLNFVKAELSTSRLMADQNPVITIIDNETGATVYSIPIVDWAKKLRTVQNLKMDDQEYLDREHEYTVMLYLVDETNGWRATSIIINGYELE